MKKMKRKRDEYGWTDHAFRRFIERQKCNLPERKRYKPRERFISLFNLLIFHKVRYMASDDLPF